MTAEKNTTVWYAVPQVPARTGTLSSSKLGPRWPVKPKGPVILSCVRAFCPHVWLSSCKVYPVSPTMPTCLLSFFFISLFVFFSVSLYNAHSSIPTVHIAQCLIWWCRMNLTSPQWRLIKGPLTLASWKERPPQKCLTTGLGYGDKDDDNMGISETLKDSSKFYAKKMQSRCRKHIQLMAQMYEFKKRNKNVNDVPKIHS